MSNNLIYIGIDDTDNLETRGTGFRARQLIELLQENKLVTGIAVTRHQLLVDARIPYTSHNSSACLVVQPRDKITDDQLMEFCSSYLLEAAAVGSDAGLCLARFDQATEVIEFGQKAKTEIIEQDEARMLAGELDIRLEGLTGDFQGIIGALSAVGLHVHGNDGRYLWPRVIRDYSGKTVTLQELKQNRGIDKVSLIDGREIEDETVQISLGDWPRTVRIDNCAVLLVEQHDAHYQYKVLEKEIIKSVRP